MRYHQSVNRRCRARLLAVGLILAVVCLLLVPEWAPADVVYLKDGFALHGKVRREDMTIVDPVTGRMIPISRSNDFVVDDRVRWVVFSPRIVQDADPEVNIRNDFVEFLKNPVPPPRADLPKSFRVERTTPFDNRWQRNVYLVGEQGRYEVTQRITALTPYNVRVDSTTYPWRVCSLTQELGPEAVKKLLDTFVDPKDANANDFDLRIKRFRFMLQAGWLTAADEELKVAERDFPNEKRLETNRKLHHQTRVRAFWEEIQTADKAGRHRYVSNILRQLPIGELDPHTAGKATELKTRYESWEQQTKDVHLLLNAITGRLVGPPRRVFAEALAAIRTEIIPDTLERLEAFRTLGTQHEQELKSQQTPTHTDDAILALAVTGWVLGREAAEPRVEAAERLWDGRMFALNYLQTHDKAARRRALEDYQRFQPLGLDELSHVIALLPPVEPGRPAATPNSVDERETQVPGSGNKKIRYLLQLPPEYQPGRSYPLLIVLSGGGERPSDSLARWSDQAARQGYILAAPEWTGAGGAFNFTPEEHLTVTEVVLDLRRRYAVDSDRVFLTGYGESATMAFDVGMSHPDLFAGVVPINGRPRASASRWYWRNAQFLPFYIVVGEKAGGGAVSLNRDLQETWMSHGYPSLMTVYQGRVTEFFQAELPFIFDWMNRKKRAAGFPELGRNANAINGEEFQTMRATDNRFYWITTDEINERNLNPAVGTRSGTPAAFTAQIRNGNEIIINARGIKKMNLWLGRVWDPQSGARSMIDFARPLRVTVNRNIVVRDRRIEPSLVTMLEDLYQRGDRQRLFLATVELTNLQ